MIEPDDLDTMIGRRFGGAVVVRLIGAGGMGAVYEAENSLLGRRYAIKVVLPELAGNASAVERFLHVTRAAAAILHPRIVSIIDCGYTEDGRPYQVMPLLDGSDLGRHCEEAGADRGHAGRLELEQAAPLFFQILDGLSAAHDRQIVHRDLKGANIQVLADQTIKILDFGIAKLFNPSLRMVARTGTFQVIGTPGYMAPEQARGGDIDYRADLWALGALFFKTMTGRLPFEGSDPVEIAARAMLTPPPTASELVPDVPAPLSRVLLSCLSPNVNDRPDSARMLAYELMDAVPGGRAIAERVAPDLLVRSGPSDPTVRRRASTRASVRIAPYRADGPSVAPTTMTDPGAAVAAAARARSTLRPRVRSRAQWRTVTIALVAAAAMGIAIAFLSRRAPDPEAVYGGAVRAGTRRDAGPPPASPLDVQEGDGAAGQDAAPRPLEHGRERATRIGKRGPIDTGMLVITATPWADVWIDRKHVNSTPVERRLAVGRHTVRMKRPDGTFDTVRVTIRDGQTTRVDRHWNTSSSISSPLDDRTLAPQ